MMRRAVQLGIARLTSKVPSATSRRAGKVVVAGGVTTSLGLSLFGKAEPKKEETAVPSSTKPANFDLIVRETDQLYENYLIDNAYAILRKWGSSECSELLWRLARVVCEKAKLSKDPEERKTYMYEAFSIVEKALQHEPAEGCFGAHKWYAILLDYVGEIEGNKSRIAKSYDVRTHLEKALEIYPNDPTTWHILGLWHFSFADMGYATRMIAKAIFGTPPTSTYDQALHCFMRAEEISPGFYSTNTFYIGEVYERLGKKEEAVEQYRASFKMPIITADDKTIHTKAHEKLRKAGVKDSQLV